MKKGLYAGWKDVYSFTMKQTADDKYRKSTVIIAIILLLIGAAISIVMAFVQKRNDDYVSPISKVYVVDDSGLANLYLDGFAAGKEETFPNVSFVPGGSTAQEAVKSLGTEETSVIMHLEEQTGDAPSYLIRVLIPENSQVSESDAEKLADEMVYVMQQSKLFSLDIPVEKLAVALSPVSDELMTAGKEEQSVGEELVQMLLPMVLMLFTYFMVILYGMTMGNVVSVEKSSKLMEMILTLTKPYGLILGKVLALAVSALVQIVLWILGFVGGFFLGDYLADSLIYPGYTNYLLDVFELLATKNTGSAFSIPALLLGFVLFLAGFVLFSAIAALVASFATKAEELSTVMGYYQILTVAAFFASYMLPMQEKEWINTILRIVPFTSAFILPGDLIVGRITLLQGGLYGMILLVTVLVMCYFAGMVYKNQIFNKGKNLLEIFGKKNKTGA